MAWVVEVFAVVLVLVWSGGNYIEASRQIQGEPYKDILADPNYKPKPEKQPNTTIDEAISSAYGGYNLYMAEGLQDPKGEVITELDMKLKPEQFKAMYMTDHSREKRKATRPLVYRWTDNTIPYEFITSHFSVDEIYYIKKSMDRWQETTCLKFKPATRADRNRIRFQNGRGCNSLLGMAGGTQPINLEARGCRYTGLYLHEIGHAIGLVHEHQLPDRDQYIYIVYDNVAPSMRIWFNKYSSKDVNQYGVPFEYSSVMHYGVTAFSKDGSSQTIHAKDKSKEHEIGRVYLKGLSFSDIKVVNKMYNCNKHCAADRSCQEPAYLDKNCRCVRPDDDGSKPTTTPKPGSCNNNWSDQECSGWAQSGECEANPVWMKENCKKSCNTCDKVVTQKPVTTRKPVTQKPEPEQCTNRYEDDYKCERWARSGECEPNKNPIWMKEWCKKACGECGDSQCTDDSPHCSSWAQAGYCATNMFTQQNCKKSCNGCAGSRDNPDSNEITGDDNEEDSSNGVPALMALPLSLLTVLAITGTCL